MQFPVPSVQVAKSGGTDTVYSRGSPEQPLIWVSHKRCAFVTPVHVACSAPMPMGHASDPG